MVFDRLHAMGKERFHKVLNALMHGETSRTLARQIQLQPPEGWGLFQGVSERTLAQQLNRLRLAAAEGAYGPEVAKQIAAGNISHVEILKDISICALERIEEVADIQRNRLLAQVEKEKITKHVLVTTNDIVAEYRKVLMDLQKLRFDLGLDEFKGPVGSSMTLRGGSVTQTFPDGMSVQKQIFEAVNTVEQIFDVRKIPQVTGR